MLTIVLRKFRGISGAAAMWKSAGHLTFGASPAPATTMGAVMAFLLSPLVFCLLATLFLFAWTLATSTDPSIASGLSLANISGFAAKLKESEDRITTKRKELQTIFEAGGVDRDFAKPEVLKLAGATDSAGVVAKVREINKELDALGKSHDELVDMERVETENAEQLKRLKSPHFRPPFPGGGGDRETIMKSLGDIVTKSAGYQTFLKNKTQGVTEEIADYGVHELKTLFQTSAGYAPESTRIGRIAEAVTRPIQVLDLIPTFPTSQAAVVYMEETLRTHNAAETAEGAAYAEDAFAFEEKTSTVRKIGSTLPVTDEQFEDVPMMNGYVNQRLMYGCRQRFDGQVLNGSGAGVNLRGINNVVGIQTQAKGGDPTPDAFYKAMTKIRTTGRAFPNAIVMHPNDWQEIRLLRTADGIYIWGSPSEVGPERMWGAQVAQADSQAEGTGLVGDFLNHCAAFDRRGIVIAIGYVGSQFGEGKKTIRADFRAAFVVFRPTAFCQVTGI